MSDQPKDGGDISSGFGDSKVSGPVSDEKAEKMLHADNDGPPADGSRDGDAEGTYSESDVATTEQDPGKQ